MLHWKHVHVHVAALLTERLSLLWMEHQSLGINEAGEGIRGNLLPLKMVIFQVERGQSGAGVTGATDAPPLHRPANVT